MRLCVFLSILHIFYVFTVNEVLIHFKNVAVFAFILHHIYIYAKLLTCVVYLQSSFTGVKQSLWFIWKVIYIYLYFRTNIVEKTLEKLSVTFGKKFVWKFSATAHGKGLVDDAGGNVKQLVQQKCMSKGKDSVVVQDAFTFADEAKKLMKETEVI